MRQPARYGRQPLRALSQQRVSIGRAVPAPVGGWDAQSPLANMPAENAVILDNFIPRAGYVELRKGYVPWQEGLPLPTESLMVWRGGTAVVPDEIFAAAGGSIYDVSNPPIRAISPLSAFAPRLNSPCAFTAAMDLTP